MQNDIDLVIEKGIERISKALNLNGIGWEYAIIDENTPQKLVESNLMAYDHQSRSIIINPQIWAILEGYGQDEMTTIFLLLSNIAHELRHAWQYNQVKYMKVLAENVPYGVAGVDYAAQIHEIDAYAFQEAFLKYCFNDRTFILDIDKSINDVVITSIHDRSKELYDMYKGEF